MADVVMAWQTGRYRMLGFWITELFALAKSQGWQYGPIFRTQAGRCWTSRHFQTDHLWLLLKEQQSLGKPLFLTCNNTPGNTLEDKFWSIHTCTVRVLRPMLLATGQGAFEPPQRTR